MPAVGTRKSTVELNRQYKKDPLHALAEQFNQLALNVQNEGVDLYMEPKKAFMLKSTEEAMKNFFIENSYDRKNKMLSAEEMETIEEDMTEQYLNDREALMEYAPIGSYNPVIGMTFPLHKNLLMNTIFDKGAIPKDVAREPKFTLSMETRILKTPDGQEIDLFLEQNKIMGAINSTAPTKETVLTLPELGTTDILKDTFSANRLDDNLSIESAISAVLVNAYVKVGDTFYNTTTKTDAVAVAADVGTKPVWVPISKLKFVPAYGTYDRQLMDSFNVVVADSATTTKTITGTIMGFVKKNMFTINCSTSDVVAVKLAASVDTSSAMLRTCSVAWAVRTDIVEIGNRIPINIPVSPEEVKDISALYQVNQLTKLMSMMKLVLGNYKDDMIHAQLDDSFLGLNENSKIASTFDFAPREGYFADHIEWRYKTFMDYLDTQMTTLFQVLNDPNMTISIIGRPELIRKLTPTEYTYQTPSSIGPVELDYVKTVTTSDKRVYQFISSDKLRNNNNLIIILCPRNTDRIVYKIFDYQLYVSNEIRNAANYALPAIHAFERWKMIQYQPVQARIKILNPTGLRQEIKNTDPIGVNMMNDYTANRPDNLTNAEKVYNDGIAEPRETITTQLG